MSSIDEQFVEFIVKSLVGNPDAVVIDRRVDEKGVLLELTVDPEDLGRIIGKRGATAQSLRTLLRALGTKNEARYNLKIVDNGPEGYERPQRDDNRANQEDDNVGGNAVTNTDDTSTPVTADDDSEESEETPATVAQVEDDKEDDNEPSDMAKRHRKDLEDLDDLDI
jgi:predicted RNA-binding protein YlqC (UPF0109 family)